MQGFVSINLTTEVDEFFHRVARRYLSFNHRVTGSFFTEFHRVKQSLKEFFCMIENEITERILRCAFKVHSALGPGLLESSYKECLFYEMQKEALYVEKEKPMPLVYEEVKLDTGYRLDLLVENKVVIEIKTVDSFNDVHLARSLLISN